ncbi:MAG: DNA repair protein RadA [Holosporales bacterium]|jgi:DNA repair protein RadA/Sms|nr:DNA repair protein RadA [Holosporales bacterium]
MKKLKRVYVCQACGATFPKWIGRCDACGAWNTLVEEIEDILPSSVVSVPGKSLELCPLDGPLVHVDRLLSGVTEFDRVCGGGIVTGSILLLGGEPGIGKSTLLLQLLARLSKAYPCLYVSGEEAVDQIRLRARRLRIEKTAVSLIATTRLEDVLETLAQHQGAFRVLVIDSIQTLSTSLLDSAAGTVAQVRATTSALTELAKTKGLVVLLVGHVTKDGMLAGPKVLEHMVDTVLYFEGDRGQPFRLLRSVKNRFGACDELGVFEMHDTGLAEVPNPSAIFLTQRQEPVPGTAVFVSIEGTRPLVVEIQALVGSTGFSTPRRSVVGWDINRLHMIIAVLETRCRFAFGQRDVYLSVTGGLRLNEPAADLAVAAALASALTNVALPLNTVIFGEVGLTGEIRSVSHHTVRLKEAHKLGFKHAFMPKDKKKGAELLEGHCIQSLQECLRTLDMVPRRGRTGSSTLEDT